MGQSWRVGRVTPCAPLSKAGAPSGAHGVTRPTIPPSLRSCEKIISIQFVDKTSYIASLFAYGIPLETASHPARRQEPPILFNLPGPSGRGSGIGKGRAPEVDYQRPAHL